MSTPSSQVIAGWVKDVLEDGEWRPLDAVCAAAITKNWKGRSQDDVLDFVEQNLPYVANHLRDEASECKIDGTVPEFEIDNEPRPYIRLLAKEISPILRKLRSIDPFELEKVCADVLTKLGAEAKETQRTNDGGVDFVGLYLKIVPSMLPVPVACTACVIGQTKRYKDGNLISESRLREFVGAATLRRHELQREGKCGPLAPTLLAFWTTSNFEPNAKRYARAIGLWYMDGRALANYVERLEMAREVMAMSDAIG